MIADANASRGQGITSAPCVAEQQIAASPRSDEMFERGDRDSRLCPASD
jgi:hypothetical protein